MAFFRTLKIGEIRSIWVETYSRTQEKTKNSFKQCRDFSHFFWWIRNIFLSHSLWHHGAQRKHRLHNWWFQVSTQGGFQQLQDIYSLSFMQDHRFKNYVLFQEWNHHLPKKGLDFLLSLQKLHLNGWGEGLAMVCSVDISCCCAVGYVWPLKTEGEKVGWTALGVGNQGLVGWWVGWLMSRLLIAPFKACFCLSWWLFLTGFFHLG